MIMFVNLAGFTAVKNPEAGAEKKQRDRMSAEQVEPKMRMSPTKRNARMNVLLQEAQTLQRFLIGKSLLLVYHLNSL